jgi:hypothetical protein
MDSLLTAAWLFAGLIVLVIACAAIWALVRLAGARPARLLPRDDRTPERN